MTDTRKGHVHLLHGFVASGKSTFARKLATERHAVRFSPDEWMSLLYGDNPPADSFDDYYRRVMSLIDKTWREVVNAGCDVVLDFGFWKFSDREAIRNELNKLGVSYTLYSVTCDREIALARCRERNKELNGSLFIDDNAFRLFESRLEPLTSDEPHMLIRTD